MRTAILLCAALGLAGCGSAPPGNSVDNAADAQFADNGTIIAAHATDPAIAQADAQRFVTAAVIGDLFIVEASTLALAKSRSPAVMAYAHQMIDAHTALGQQLADAIARLPNPPAIPIALDPPHREIMSVLSRSAKGAEFETSYLDTQTDTLKAALALVQAQATGEHLPAVQAHAKAIAPEIEQQLALTRSLDKSGADGR